MAARLSFVLLLALAGCTAEHKPDVGMAPELGLQSKVDNAAALAAISTFYVVPNTQVTMSDTFSTGVSLSNYYAAVIAERLGAQGLTQAPAAAAEARVVFSVQDPTPAPSRTPADTESLAYADQMLREGQSMLNSNNFLAAEQVNFRVVVIRNSTGKTVWHGTIAGVQDPSVSTIDRTVVLRNALVKLLGQYPRHNAR